MTLPKLVLIIAIVALVLTILTAVFKKGVKSYVMTFLQNFCGALFVFSGWVKAVDPLGTAYKMEQYFTEFESLFEPTWFSFLAPLFPFLSKYVVAFSVFVIILEIIIGLMLLLGMRTKLTSWIFLLLVGFFTVLTGFTFLTGYVPEGATFFQFGNWAGYNESSMKVQDCGCFGDFLKLKPRISFFKDIFLLFPAIFFVFRHKDMTQLFSKEMRTGIIGIATIGLFIYCLSNYKWDIPHADFRPFKIGADIATAKQNELDAAANVQVVGWKLESKKEPGKIVELSNEVYMKEWAKYPKEEWTVVDQIKTKPAIEKTKASDFEIQTLDGDEAADALLSDENYTLWIVCQKLKGVPSLETKMVRDSIFRTDSIANDAGEMEAVKSLVKVDEKEVSYYKMYWDNEYTKKWKEVVNPFVDAAKENGINTNVFIGKFGKDEVLDFAEKVGPEATYYTADDILLKTIVRSNPGVVLVKNGVIIHKWHIKKLPDFATVKKQFAL